MLKSPIRTFVFSFSYFCKISCNMSRVLLILIFQIGWCIQVLGSPFNSAMTDRPTDQALSGHCSRSLTFLPDFSVPGTRSSIKIGRVVDFTRGKHSSTSFFNLSKIKQLKWPKTLIFEPLISKISHFAYEERYFLSINHVNFNLLDIEEHLRRPWELNTGAWVFSSYTPIL